MIFCILNEKTDLGLNAMLMIFWTISIVDLFLVEMLNLPIPLALFLILIRVEHFLFLLSHQTIGRIQIDLLKHYYYIKISNIIMLHDKMFDNNS